MKNKTIIILVMLISIFGFFTYASEKDTVLNKTVFDSLILKEKIKIQIHLPARYNQSKGSYPVFYMLDGNFFMNQAVAAVDFLANPKYMNRLIPNYIIVGITTKDRNHDFTPTFDEVYNQMPFPTSGGAEKFHDFLTKELFPFIKTKYRVTEKRLLAGWSLAGLFTTWTWLKHPGSFDKYLAISPSLWWDDMLICTWIEESITKKTLSNKKLTVTLGSLETGDMSDSVKGRFLPLMKKQKQNINFQYIEIHGEGHNTGPYTSIYKGLKSLDFLTLIPEEISKGKESELKKYLLELAGEFGYKTQSAGSASNFLIKQTVTQGTYEVGLQIADLYARRLSSSSKAMLILAEMYLRLERNKKGIEVLKEAIEREQRMEKPDQKQIKYYQEYIDWAKKRIK